MKFDALLVETDIINTARCSNYPPFVALPTLTGLRITINSMIQIVESLLFEYNYEYVLTGKLNQDCIEVREKMKQFILFSN